MQGVTKTPHSSSLAQVVCNWQPSKLSELAKAYSDSCSPPEVTFSSYDSYKAYFEPLLLAEVAADLLSTSEKFQRSHTVRLPKVRARREEPGTTVAVVAVSKVSRKHSWGFGWTVELDTHDGRGSVGCIDNDVVVLWRPDTSKNLSKRNHSRPKPTASPHIPDSAVHAVVARTTTRTGCRLVLSKFPDGNEQGIRTDLEEGEENEEGAPTLRVWNLLRLGSLTTMKREFDALQSIKTSVLLPTLLRPQNQPQQVADSRRERDDAGPTAAATTSSAKPSVVPEKSDSDFRNEHTFTHVIAGKTGLNPSQSRAILHASTCRNGFSVIQGPPGTGKTRTLISLLNVIHMTQYQEYYEGLLASFASVGMNSSQDQDDSKEAAGRETTASSEGQVLGTERGGDDGFLQSMLVAMDRTFKMFSKGSESRLRAIAKRARRPRLLICAPSNSAVDEILTRLTHCKFVDGRGREYCPELARIGNGDRVSEAAKPFTAEGQAEAFLDRLCAEDMIPEAQKKAQMAFLSTWQGRCNSLLVQLARTPKRDPSSHPVIVDLHEKLERMDRDLRRLSIAASDGAKDLKREEKLRQIARTYVEDAQLVFATLSGSASSILTKKGANDMTGSEGALFDTVVIDEGAQATEPSCLIPMALGATRCLLVGDPQQLPATVLASGAAGLAYGQSLLERVCKGGQDVQLLDTQYRMHPAISSFPRRYFYHGRLVDDESVQGENRARAYHRDDIRPKLGPYVFLDIAEGEESRSRDDRSIFNRSEAELASLIYTKIKKEYPKDSLFSSASKVQGSVSGFGVVTPYKRQMQELRQSFDRAGIPTGDVEIDTVDSFQGREKDVIVFSCVRTASLNRGIGFVRDVRRMNVGLTRARCSLIILGSAQALAEGSADWAELVEDATSRGCLINVSSVSRCLLPPVPSHNRHSATETEQQLQSRGSKELVNGSSEMRTGLQGPTAQTQRNPVMADRVDPRRRMPKRALVVDSNAIASERVPVNREIKATVPQQLEDTASVPLRSSVVQRETATSQGSSTGATDVFLDNNPELLSTLQQTSKFLEGLGFHNSSRIEKTLREHIRNGGRLEVEVIMAAAFASSNAGPDNFVADQPQFDAAVGHLADTEPKHSPPVSAGGNIQGDGKESRRPVEALTVDQKKQKQPLEPQRDKAIASKQVPPKEQSSVPHRHTDATNSEGRGQVLKPIGREKPQDNKPEKSEGQAPSGWDMLFSGKSGSSSGKGKDSSAIKDPSAAATKNDSAQVAQNGTGEKADLPPPKMTEAVKATKPTEQAGIVTTTPLSPKSSEDKNADVKEQRLVAHKHTRKPWIESNREVDRKRQRSGEYSANNGARGGNGFRNDRGRGRPKRGRGRGNFSHDPRGRDKYGKTEHWTSAQYDHSYAPPYAAVGGVVMDPGMGSAPAVDPMQVLQQQHVMQQAYQQQQVMQQQAFQHQMHQQAFQQEAMMQQQAAMMQMPGGIPMGPLHPHTYQNDFDGGTSNPGLGGQGRSQRNDNWTYGGRGNRGRGRSRMKYGGRNRRGG